MAFKYFLVGEKTAKRYACCAFPRIAIDTAISLSKASGEIIRIQDANYKLIDRYIDGISEKERRNAKNMANSVPTTR